MKTTLLAAFILSSFSVSAAPYLGLEYGYGHTNHDVGFDYNQDNVILSPDSKDGIFGGFIGYAFNDKWAVEVGYSQFELEDDRSMNKGIEGNFKKEWEWDSSIKAKQISIAPVYTYAFNDKFAAKVKAGLIYSQYDVNSGKYQELEHIVNDDLEMRTTLESHSEKQNELGALVSVGAEYKLFQQLALGVNAKYQIDGFSSTASINANTAYYF